MPPRLHACKFRNEALGDLGIGSGVALAEAAAGSPLVLIATIRPSRPPISMRSQGRRVVVLVVRFKVQCQPGKTEEMVAAMADIVGRPVTCRV